MYITKRLSKKKQELYILFLFYNNIIDEIEDIKNPPFTGAVVGNTYSGTVSGSHTGTYYFRCIYNSGNTYYFLCITNMGSTTWYIACGYSWTVTIQGKTVTAKIPTNAQIGVATQANRTTGFRYWTSNVGNDGSNRGCMIETNGVFSITTASDKYGVVSLAIITV